MTGTRGTAAVVALVGLAVGCGAHAQTSASGKARACSGKDVTASSSGIIGTNDGSNPDGPGRRRSTLAGITLRKRAGSPCVLSGIGVEVLANGHALNVRYRDFPDSNPIGTMRSRGDIATTSVAWFAPWCGRTGQFTYALKWPDGTLTSADAQAVPPPCDATTKNTSFVTASKWVVNPGTSVPQTTHSP